MQSPSATIDLKQTPFLPQDGEGPVFPAPWAARAFAITVKLSESGCFTWSEWVAAFGAELARSEHGPHAQAGAVDDYYHCWVDTLETLLERIGVVDPGARDFAYSSTLAAWPEPDHHARREPISCSPPVAAACSGGPVADPGAAT